MKKLTILITLITLSSLAFSQSVEIKDSSDETLMIVNDEGTGKSSITVQNSLSAPTITEDKLYNEGGTLKWNGSALGTGGNTLDQAYDQGGAGAGRTITADAGAFNVGGVDGALFTGNYGTGVIPIGGAGTRLMWYPKKAAFRVGYVDGTQWNDPSIGEYSTAMGAGTTAIGNYSTALGQGTTASESSSTAMGIGTIASGHYSTALGCFTVASGVASTALGYHTYAEAYASVALGRFNVGGGTSGWINTEPLFEIGIGTDESNRKNAFTVLKSGNVGIGTNSPVANLHVSGDNGILFNGTFGTGVIPIEGAGTRMMWYPSKAAFRVGYVDGTQWDDSNIGNASTAMGYETTASGTASTAMGYETTASGDASTAMGSSTTASGDPSTATGHGTTASGNYSTAMGYNTTASGIYSTAMGYWTTASEMASTAMGYTTTASGYRSTAMGNHVSTNDKAGSFIIGDNSGSSIDITTSLADNEMTMIFMGGYRLFTNDGASTGATLAAGGSSWGTVSDSTKKENYQNADSEYFLNSIAKLRLGSWNYKSQDAKDFRHYGPMAQEIFHYFGKDDYGTVGNDTTLATADMDGIMMIALQALEKRTSELKEENHDLKTEIAGLKSIINEILMIKD